MEFRWEGIISIAILFFIGLIIYCKVSKKGVSEGFADIINLFKGGENE